MDRIVFYLGYSFLDERNFKYIRSIGTEKHLGISGVKFITGVRLIRERCKHLQVKRTL